MIGLLVSGTAPALADERPAAKAPAAEESVEALVARAVGTGFDEDAAAIAEVLRRKRRVVLSSLQKALFARTDFHERITLGYMLAAHGEKVGLEILVDSLQHRGHFGYIYLRRVAPEDFGWNADGSSYRRWRDWLDRLSEEEYRESTRRARLPAKVRGAGDAPLLTAARAFRDGAERTVAAERFRGVALKFPDADAAPLAREIADAIDQEVEEDAAWKGPETPPAPGDPKRLEWLVHHLRDVKGVRRYSVSYTTVLPPRHRGEPAVETPATELLALGPAAVPTLLGLLDDRRPIRAFGWTMQRVGPRSWGRRLVVLRVQDAALEILNALLPPPTYDRPHTATYLSAQDPRSHAATVADVRSWAEKTLGKSGDEAVWAGIRRARTEDAVAQLRRMATSGRQDAVLEELRRMCEERSWLHRPIIVELMAQLGDRSRVGEIVKTLAEGKYSSHLHVGDGDSAVSLRAEAAAKRVRDRYGKDVNSEGDEPPPK